MLIMTSSDEKKQREIREERKQTFIKFLQDLSASFKIWMKIGGVVSAFLIIAYLFARLILNWNLFYETDLDYSKMFFMIFIFFAFCVLACWLVAFFLYNTKHRRNTKYKEHDISCGGNNNAKKA